MSKVEIIILGSMFWLTASAIIIMFVRGADDDRWSN
jgi:hypothetical protein